VVGTARPERRLVNVGLHAACGSTAHLRYYVVPATADNRTSALEVLHAQCAIHEFVGRAGDDGIEDGSSRIVRRGSWVSYQGDAGEVSGARWWSSHRQILGGSRATCRQLLYKCASDRGMHSSNILTHPPSDRENEGPRTYVPASARNCNDCTGVHCLRRRG